MFIYTISAMNRESYVTSRDIFCNLKFTFSSLDRMFQTTSTTSWAIYYGPVEAWVTSSIHAIRRFQQMLVVGREYAETVYLIRCFLPS